MGAQAALGNDSLTMLLVGYVMAFVAVIVLAAYLIHVSAATKKEDDR